MNAKDEDEIEFDRISDAVERYLSLYGEAYAGGEGDFSQNHDYYGNKELGVIILKPIFNELLLRQFQSTIQSMSLGWEIWVTFYDGAEWQGHQLIVITSDSYRSVKQ